MTNSLGSSLWVASYHQRAGAGLDPTLARTGKLSRLIDWLGSARRHNERINDEMETLKFEVEVLRWANRELRAELTEAKPLIAYALKRKASLAAYERKRGRG